MPSTPGPDLGKCGIKGILGVVNPAATLCSGGIDSCNQLKVNSLLCFRKHRNSPSLDQSGGPGAPGLCHCFPSTLRKTCARVDSFPEGFPRPSGRVSGSQATGIIVSDRDDSGFLMNLYEIGIKPSALECLTSASMQSP